MAPGNYDRRWATGQCDKRGECNSRRNLCLGAGQKCILFSSVRVLDWSQESDSGRECTVFVGYRGSSLGHEWSSYMTRWEQSSYITITGWDQPEARAVLTHHQTGAHTLHDWSYNGTGIGSWNWGWTELHSGGFHLVCTLAVLATNDCKGLHSVTLLWFTGTYIKSWDGWEVCFR